MAISTRLLLLFADSFPFDKLSKSLHVSCFHRSFHFQNRRDRAPLTLSTLGILTDLDTSNSKHDPSLARHHGDDQKLKKTMPKPKTNSQKESPDMEGAPLSTATFSQIGLSHLLTQRLAAEGLHVPTQVQSSAIPQLLNKRDVIIQSYTGSGKTLAYLLPLLSSLPCLENVPLKRYIEAVIVAPSRELGMQIVREIQKLLGHDNRKLVQQLVGGANITRQEDALRHNKPFILVGTPGRLAEISCKGKLRTRSCKYLVLDESDELLGSKFQQEICRIIENVGERVKGSRQLVMVSATMPFSVVHAATMWGCDPILVKAGGVEPLDALPSDPANVARPSPASLQTSSRDSLPPALKHYYCVARLQHKVDMLRKCVNALEPKCVIAFMNHTRQLKDTVFKLRARGMNAAELHGDLGKMERSTTLNKFKSGAIRILVTNELSARGLDVAECDLVVNIELPTDAIHYTHRAGRAGRLGRKGNVVNILEEKDVFVVEKMERQLGVPIKPVEFLEGEMSLITDKQPKGEGKT